MKIKQHNRSSRFICKFSHLLIFSLLIILSSHIAIFSQSIDYTHYQDILTRFVDSNGKVNYSHLQPEKNKLILISDQLRQERYSQLSADEELCYWINLYNLETIRLIVENYPIKSIQNLDQGKTWDVKRIKLIGKTVSLNMIENEILRKKFKEPRIHFALNCGAISCPPLYNKVYLHTIIDSQLNDRTRAFINNPKYNKISKKKISISKIFDWYKEDFGTPVNFLNQYSKIEISDPAKVIYLDYDWKINGQ